MDRSARVGQFGQPASIYGSFAPVVKPIDNVAVPSAAQQVADAASAQTDLLIQQLQALQSQGPVPTTPTVPPAPAPTPYYETPPAVVPPVPPAPTVDYAQAISTLDRYIANLSAVANPTPFQQQELQTYIARRADYASR